MKKFQLLFSLLVIVLTASCEDATDIIQPGTLDASAAFTNVEDLELGRLGLYRLLDTSDEVAFASRFTDETRLGFDNGGQARDLYTFQLNSATGLTATMWSQEYRIIREATAIIDAAETLEIDPADQAEADNIAGQARVIRAWAHFKLMTYFCTDMTDDSTLGVPIVDFIPGLDFQPLRNTTGEVFDFIDAELAIAIPQVTESSVLFFNADAVTAFRARMAAYRGQYGIAEPLAQQLVNAYPLATTAEYPNVYADLANNEVIFKLERAINDRWDTQATGNAGGGWYGSLFAFTGPGVDGSPYMEGALELWNSYDAGDVRRDVNLIRLDAGAAGNPVARPIHIVNKYQGSEGVPLMNDGKVFRASEMVLILAEARAAANDPAGAAALIDDIRDARFGSDQPTPSYANATEAWGGIIDERRLELAYEGHRYLDLRRLGALGNRTISRDVVDCSQLGTCTLPITDFRFTFPIPQAELIGNPDMRDQQNPGYSE